MAMLLLAAISFVGTHFLLSHTLRLPIVKAVGERSFQAIFSLVALATFIWLCLGTIDSSILAGRRRSVGERNCRNAARIGPAGRVIQSQPGPADWWLARKISRVRAWRVRDYTPSDDVGVYLMGAVPHSGLSDDQEYRCRRSHNCLGARRRGAPRPQKGTSGARFLANVGSENQLLSVRGPREREGTSGRPWDPSAPRWFGDLARGELGSYPSIRLGGRRMALDSLKSTRRHFRH